MLYFGIKLTRKRRWTQPLPNKTPKTFNVCCWEVAVGVRGESRVSNKRSGPRVNVIHTTHVPFTQHQPSQFWYQTHIVLFVWHDNKRVCFSFSWCWARQKQDFEVFGTNDVTTAFPTPEVSSVVGSNFQIHRISEQRAKMQHKTHHLVRC